MNRDNFPSKLHFFIYQNASKNVLEITKDYVDQLKLDSENSFSIEDKKFKLVELEGRFFVFESKRKRDKCEYVDGVFNLNKKPFTVIKFVEDESVDINTFDSSKDSLELEDENLGIINLIKPVDSWFVLNTFPNAEDFWKDLKSYYWRNSSEIGKIVGISSFDSPYLSIFSKQQAQITVPNLNDAVVQKISARIQSLEEHKESIKNQIYDLESTLSKAGVIPSEERDFQELVAEQKQITECIFRAKSSLEQWSSQLKNIGDYSREVPERLFLDVFGNLQLTSRYWDRVIQAAIDLNTEVTSIYQCQKELETNLIGRLKDIDNIKDLSRKLREFEREQILEDYREKKQIFNEKQDREETLRQLGSIHESTAELQRRIQKEKENVNYYLNNLKDINRYESIERSYFEHEKKKRQLRRKSINFEKEVYKLKLSFLRAEKRYDSFFSDVKHDIQNFREEVSQAFKDHFTLAEECVNKWKHQWSEEAVPAIENFSKRTDDIVSCFAPIPQTQIVKLYRLQEKLKNESISRQIEWNRISDEINKEFRNLGYELTVSAHSELDQKYLEKIDSVDLELSAATEKAIFISSEQFSLANSKDSWLGLDPKIMDDDEFTVIDQVWTKLTPEQEKMLDDRLFSNRRGKLLQEAELTKQDLIKNQMDSIKNRIKVKLSSLELSSNLFTKAEKVDKYSEIEDSELKVWKEDNYLIANSRGDFKDVLYGITQKLFKLRSVRIVENNLEFTDTGYVRDGGTEILSAKDYFIKSPMAKPFSDSLDEIDLTHGEDIHSEPNEEAIELLSDSEYLGHISKLRERDESSSPKRPTSLSEWAQISASKFREEKAKEFELSKLQEKLITLDEEIRRIKEFHDNKTKQLSDILKERSEAFDDLQEGLKEVKEFLSGQDGELTKLITDECQSAEVDNIMEVKKTMFSEFEHLKADRKKKQGFVYWFNRLMYGERNANSDSF